MKSSTNQIIHHEIIFAPKYILVFQKYALLVLKLFIIFIVQRILPFLKQQLSKSSEEAVWCHYSVWAFIKSALEAELFGLCMKVWDL